MKKYKVYGIGAALVDTEVKVDDADLAAMNVEKGLMTLVEEPRLKELLGHFVVTEHHRLNYVRDEWYKMPRPMSDAQI